MSGLNTKSYKYFKETVNFVRMKWLFTDIEYKLTSTESIRDIGCRSGCKLYHVHVPVLTMKAVLYLAKMK